MIVIEACSQVPVCMQRWASDAMAKVNTANQSLQMSVLIQF